MQIMIELHRIPEDSYADEIEDRFKKLVIAYRTVQYDPTQISKLPLPHILESGKVISGNKQIESYLIELEKELQWQRSLSGDGCYIDPDSGEVC
jgi:hypothetical protein